MPRSRPFGLVNVIVRISSDIVIGAYVEDIMSSIVVLLPGIKHTDLAKLLPQQSKIDSVGDLVIVN